MKTFIVCLDGLTVDMAECINKIIEYITVNVSTYRQSRVILAGQHDIRAPFKLAMKKYLIEAGTPCTIAFGEQLLLERESEDVLGNIVESLSQAETGQYPENVQIICDKDHYDEMVEPMWENLRTKFPEFNLNIWCHVDKT